MGLVGDISSIEYQGLFNENFFNINSINRNKLLSLESTLQIFENPLTLKKETFLANFIKTKYDGLGYRNRDMDMVIMVDISGSMGSSLGKSTNSCLSLAKIAINKLTTKINPNDRLGVIEFNDLANTVYPLQAVKDTTELKNHVDKMKPNGGTTLSVAIKAGIEMIRQNFEKDKEKRIVFLTDMNDLSDKAFEAHIKEAAKENIFISIIGIGLSFNSSFTERISKNKGLNYFSAIKEEHLDKIIVEDFEYNFFPLAFNVSLEFKSGNYLVSKTFGSGYEKKEEVDKSEWNLQNHKLNDETFKNIVKFLLLYFQRIKKRLPKPILAGICNCLKYNKKTICNINSFYSGVLKNNEEGGLTMEGGLILLRLDEEKVSTGDKSAIVTLKYEDIYGNVLSDDYIVNTKQNKEDEEKSSSKAIEEAVGIYYYGSFLRRCIKFSNKNKDYDYMKPENLQKSTESVKKTLETLLSKNKTLYNKFCEKVDKMVDIMNKNNEKNKEKENQQQIPVVEVNNQQDNLIWRIWRIISLIY